ncbi:ATP-dependent dethiobiotin synthetase BioD OS=Streptomyces rimosus subsp. rimosus (strain ATCC/ DSM 40260 / JCM 4667 / NRRL 2234) OX=1265868 GN=bioD PE=3 SV=1 [Streptomyces rimosus subsp. rimosus]
MRLAESPVLVVAQAGLGALNAVALTALALRSYGIESPGIVVGSWPARPGLAARCNLDDFPEAAGAPLLGRIPEGAGGLLLRGVPDASTGLAGACIGGTA